MKRYPIESDTVIKINGVNIRVDEHIGKGSTCLVYNGRILDGESFIPQTQVTIKEFYPKSSLEDFDITRDSEGKLCVSQSTRENPEYKEKRKQFESGCEMQRHLANSEVMEVMVKPLLSGDYGDTSYLVSDIHMGKSLDNISFDTLEDKLSCAVRVVELFGILHQSGYVMLDFKPENLLWTESPKSVKLIDTDSIFKYTDAIAVYDSNGRVAADVGKEDVFYINQKYSAPEILALKDMLDKGAASLSEKKSEYLKPNVNVYSLGCYLFELLFGRSPSSEDREFPESLLEELCSRYKIEFDNRKIAGALLDVLKKSLKQKPRQRYQDGGSMMEELNACIKEITARKYQPKRTVAQANNMYLSYNLLEKYPLYEYAHKEGDTTILDVVIAGTHSIRESLLKVIISCGQMLDSVLNIRLFAEDAETFWNYFKSADCNPELRKTVQWIINGKLMDNTEKIRKAAIVESPLANIYLYTDDSVENIAGIMEENKINYTIFAYGQDEKDYEKATNLVKALPRKKHFVGYLSGEQRLQVKNKDRIQVYPIRTGKTSDSYDEKAYSSHIYNMGMSIHEYYYRGNHPRATKAEIREDYAKDFYNIESSERSALHANYKLKSIGIDPETAKAPYLYYENVLSSKTGEAKELFDKLAALEHRSWTAFLVLSGVRAVGDVQTRMKQYAYVGKSDWKERDESGRIISHPCLRASRPGRGLTPAIWGNRGNEGKLKQLDPLDRRSLEIYDAVCSIVEQENIKGKADQGLKDIEKVFGNITNNEVSQAYDVLCSSKDKIFERETNSPELWHQAVAEFTEICQDEGVYSKKLKEKMDDIEKLLRPALWCVNYHDFKGSDEDILYALPRVLIQNSKIQQKDGKIILIKPMVKEMWKNIYSSIVIQPDCLVLVPFHREGEESELLEQYSAKLKSFHLTTHVQVKTLNQLRSYGKNGQIFIDETGSEPEHSRALAANPYMKDAHMFKVEKRTLKPTDGNALISLFNRQVNLTVRETLELHDVTMISETKPDYIVGLSATKYKSLWNLYRGLGGPKWKVLIDELGRFENGKQTEIKLGNAGNLRKYESEYVEANIIRAARIEKILEELKANEVISSYDLPKENAYGKVRYETTYEYLARQIEKMISQAAKEPLLHAYQIVFENNKVIISDDSLYVSGIVPHEEHEVIKRKDNKDYYRDMVMQEACRLLNENSKDEALQNLRCKEENGKGKWISFRYASPFVREVLRKEGSLLEALIFQECRKKEVFDDIRVNVEIQWPGDRTRNEIDIIGTKNSKTYFISAKMPKPETAYIYEVQSLCDQFSVEGHAILVSSHYTTGVNERTGKDDYKERPRAFENRVKDMRDVSFVGKDSVDIVVEDKTGNNQKKSRRQIEIGSSIQKIVEAEN